MIDATPHVPTAPAPTLTAPTVEPHTKNGLSTSEAATITGWIKEDLASGKMTQAQADQAFAELNTPMEQRGPDTRTHEEKELDKHFPPGKQSDYRIAYGLPGQDVPMTPELKQFDTTTRTWLSEAQFPRDVGNSLVTAIAKTAQHTKDMTPDQLGHYGYAEFAKLERAYGDTLDDKLRAAGQMVEALDKKTSGLKSLLKSKGLGDNALIASMLIQQAERWHARREAQGTR
jgi:hypothetical protein